jgi:hypothetical protein
MTNVIRNICTIAWNDLLDVPKINLKLTLVTVFNEDYGKLKTVQSNE